MTLNPIRMPAVSKCLPEVRICPSRRVPTILSTLTMATLAFDASAAASTVTMVTSAFDTPVTAAVATLKVDCLPVSNSDTDMGIETATVTI